MKFQECRLKLRFSTLLAALSLFCLPFAAQNTAPVAAGKDADERNPSSAKALKKSQKKTEEKKTEEKRKEKEKEEKKEGPAVEKKGGMTADTFSGLKFRPIGPAVASGRVMSIAVNPKKTNEYYVGVASGGVWKTVNDGTTWTPVFDGEGSYGYFRGIALWTQTRSSRCNPLQTQLEVTRHEF